MSDLILNHKKKQQQATRFFNECLSLPSLFMQTSSFWYKEKTTQDTESNVQYNKVTKINVIKFNK